jgi:hypothetical protein
MDNQDFGKIVAGHEDAPSYTKRTKAVGRVNIASRSTEPSLRRRASRQA